MEKSLGRLYICSTPIGNLEDITLRVLRVLREVDIIACEDTRETIKLLNHYDISKPLISYHEHNKEKIGPQIIEKLKNGENIALVSDAGMPGISDPGEDLVKLCIEEEIPFEVLPGANAALTALVASGLSTRRYSFEGFLDREKKNRRKRIERIREEDRTIIIYESPHRLLSTLKDLMEILGDRHMAVARELTKKFEEVVRGRISYIVEHFTENSPRGEFVLIIEGNKEEPKDSPWEGLSIKEHVLYYINQGIPKKEAIKMVSKDRDIPKREVYNEAISIEG